MTDGLNRAATLRKFNPGAMQSDAEIIRQFVVRSRQFDSVMEVLRENLDSRSNQHLLVVAPRGRGKTMLLARVAAELRRDEELSKRMLPVRFMEESMEVLGIADFWLECLLHLANALAKEHPVRTASLRQSRAGMAEIMDDKNLEQKARAAVLDVADELDRRLVLMVENLQDLTQDTDADFGWQMRKILQNEPRIMLLASATTRFTSLDDAEAPFFELFREIQLPPLNNQECLDLWQAATGDAITAREIRPLQILTGGSPRLLVLIAGFSRHHSMRQLMEELVTLIDDHTEYFRGHLDALPPKERRVYLGLIDLWQPSTAREVAQRVRMDIRTASSLLGRLVKRGAVTVEQESPKKKFYSATERLYSIYYKLRRERNEAAVVQGLVHFMAAFYTGPDLQTLVATLVRECREAPGIMEGVQLAIRKDEVTREHLISYMSYDDFNVSSGTDGDAVEWVKNRKSLALEALGKSDNEAALGYLDQVIERFGDAKAAVLRELAADTLLYRGQILGILKRHKEKLDSFEGLLDRFGDSKNPKLQSIVSIPILLMLDSGNLESAIALFNLWYRKTSVTAQEAQPVFWAATLMLYLSGLPADRLLEILESDPVKSGKTRPISVALRLEMGETVRAPSEIMEVAADIRRQIEILRDRTKLNITFDDESKTPSMA